ncbi:VQ motif-containing protein 1-like [Andrographis paniculata]|uniref:VQ motif-containing protein 1-like n=1 Tax=Andrographis paniculata TaxID=175694 RepID=UPI0021E75E76|nr:VQ motif-containing protein 1-like [Andrographis paniculata]
MGGGNDNPVKIVIINTQYVETDAGSFKSVVQRLTGKETVQSPAPAPELRRGMSFKELDRILSEMPPLDELRRLLW